MSYYISAPLHPYNFAKGEIPDLTTFGDKTRYPTMADCVAQKELLLFPYCGQNIATITLTVNQDIDKPFTPSDMTHVTIHTYDAKTKQAFRYDVDVKDGHIPWEELRKTYAGELYGPNRGSDIYHASNVGKVQIVPQSTVTIGMVGTARELYRFDGYSYRDAYSSIESARASTEIARINEGLPQAGKRCLCDIDMNQVCAKYVSSLQTPHELAAYQFAHLTDITSVKMQEVWQTKYEQYLQSGYDEHQAYSLSMVHTTSAALMHELGPTQYTPQDEKVLQDICNLAMQEAGKDCAKSVIRNAQENGPIGASDVPATVFGALTVDMFDVKQGVHPCTYRPEVVSYYTNHEWAKTESFRGKYTEGRPELGFVVSTTDPCALTGCTAVENLPKSANVHLYVAISVPHIGPSQLIDVTHMSTSQLQTLADMTIQKRPISEIQHFIESTVPGDGTVGDADGHDEHEVEDEVL